MKKRQEKKIAKILHWERREWKKISPIRGQIHRSLFDRYGKKTSDKISKQNVELAFITIRKLQRMEKFWGTKLK